MSQLWYSLPLCESLVKTILQQNPLRLSSLPSVHPYAMLAALASEAAGKQHKFWEMHQLIFENQGDLSEYNLLYYAEMLQLDMSLFIADCKSPDLQEKVDSDREGGMRYGVNRTPTFFINSERLDSYDDSYESLLNAIQ